MKNSDECVARCNRVEAATSKRSPSRKHLRAARQLVCSALLLAITSCSGGGGGFAANGGMSGTGISQGTITAFGSIFVNGVQWEISSAAIVIDGAAANEADLRLGMVVRVEGDFDASATTGSADRVTFDDSIEGPIEADPIETVVGVTKEFMVLGQTVIIRSSTTVFADGASFDGLAADDVVEVSGFSDPTGAIEATRIVLKGQAPGNSEVELRGLVANLSTNPNGTGLFNLGQILVHYDAVAEFSGVTRETIEDGDLVEIEGVLRVTGDEIDADSVELETEGLGAENATRVEIEGIVALCAQSSDFCVGTIPVDASLATFDPSDFVPVQGDPVEVEGELIEGVLIAESIEFEEEEDEEANVRIEAEVTSVDATARTLSILGITVSADADTIIKDESPIEDEDFTFGEILVGDFLIIKGVDEGGSTIRALLIERDNVEPGQEQVWLEGIVTSLNTTTPSLGILGQPIPLSPGTLYFNESDLPRTEEEFFRNPGDVMIGDIVRAIDASAASLSTLSEVDSVTLSPEDD